MEERRHGRLEPIPPIQLGLLALVILVLAVVVASASRPGDSGPLSPPSSPATGAAILRAGLVLVGLFEAGVLALVVWALWPGRRPVRRLPVGGERWLYLAVSFLQSAAVMILLWLYIHYHPALGGGRGGPLSGLLSRTAGVNLPDRPGALVAGEAWLTVAIVAAVLMLVAAFVGRAMLRRRDRRGTPLQQLARRLQDAVEEGLEELEAEPDPRRAVIAAYARMARSMGRVGLPRRSSETALEYLRRLLEMVHLDNPAATRLTDLFQVAKFSDHPIDQAMKREAIEALVAVRDDLRELATDQPLVTVPA
jgi:Domain of unknown function (DUF4129)